jgi:hypothetical protein
VKYFKETHEGIYSFDLWEFMDIQKAIYDKYKHSLEGLSQFEITDRYIMQTLEEVHEVWDSRDEQHRIDETVDVMMYLGSLYWALGLEPGVEYHEVVVIHGGYVNSAATMSINKMAKDVFGMLMSGRRMFPERKWHKPFKKEDVDFQRWGIFGTMVLKAIMDIATILIQAEGPEQTDSRIREKQTFIETLSLPK